jgi:hypothetical protein
MPWGLKRYQQARDLHFITFSCYHRAPLLDKPQVARLFPQVFEQSRRWFTGEASVVEIQSRWTAMRREQMGNHFDSWPARRLRTQPPQKSRKAGAPGTGTPNSRASAQTACTMVRSETLK